LYPWWLLLGANFRELRVCELRRMPIPRTWVNKPLSYGLLGLANPLFAYPLLWCSGRRCRPLSNIVLSGKSGPPKVLISSSPGSVRPIGLPISSSPGSKNHLCTAHKSHIVPRRKRFCIGVLLREHSNHRRSQSAWRISSHSGRYIVLSGKYGGSHLSSCPGTNTVLAGKPYRPAGEPTSFHPGRYIVFSGKIYRLARENLSSSPGNMGALFAANARFSLRRTCEPPVFVCVNCLLCF
jgi:hypothetical protein